MDAPEEQWFVRRDGFILGPYSRAELELLVQRGKVGGDDAVSPNGKHPWRALRSLSWFPREPKRPPLFPASPSRPVETPATIEAGVLIDGRYQLAARLGQGTYGEVWRALDTRLSHRSVALKFLKTEFLSSFEVLARFEAEADALAHVQHANVVALLDRGTWQRRRFLVTEFVPGPTLRQWIDALRETATFPEVTQVLELIDQICAGVDAAHQVRVPGPIVHRDLKPDNIILRESASGETTIKIVDFGIAQLGLRSGTRSGAMLGTPLYMAPEQGLGNASDASPALDVFAIAVITFEALTLRATPAGQTPWWGLTLQHPMHLQEYLRASRGDVPDAVWEGLARALSAAPAERPPTAGALRAMLRESFASSPRLSLGTLPLGRSPTPPSVPPVGPLGTLPMDAVAGSQPAASVFASGSPLPALARLAPHPSHAAGAPPAGLRPRSRVTLIAATSAAVAVVTFAMFTRTRGSSPATRVDAGHDASAPPTVPAPPPCPADMVLLQGGAFTMGSTTADSNANEKPAHRVSVESFCIDRTEVTVLAYRACVDSGGCTPASATVRYSNKPWPDNVFRFSFSYYRTQTRAVHDVWNAHCTYTREGFERHPVTCVDWRQARAYCAWARRRLPREAEWEFAARGSEGSEYPWGASILDGTRANVGDGNYRRLMRFESPARNSPYETIASIDDGFAATAPVGAYVSGATPRGVFDLAGNVWEWTQDRYAAYSDDPSDPAPVDPTARVARGGGFASGLPADLRATRRAAISEEDRISYLGFRCAAGLFSTTDGGNAPRSPIRLTPPIERDDGLGPARRANPWITIPGHDHALLRHEVTRAEYAEWLATQPRPARVPWSGSDTPTSREAALPVVEVEWREAHAYCVTLGARLPTQAEWTTAYARSASLTLGTSLSAVGSNPSDSTPAGVLDMAGSVSEWLDDQGSTSDERLQIGGSFLDELVDIDALTQRGSPVQVRLSADVRVRRSPARGFRCARRGVR